MKATDKRPTNNAASDNGGAKLAATRVGASARACVCLNGRAWRVVWALGGFMGVPVLFFANFFLRAGKLGALKIK